MVICFCNISTASDPSNVSLYIEKADIFEKDNDYKRAREILEYGLEETNSLSILSEWQKMDNELYDQIVKETISLYYNGILKIAYFDYSDSEIKKQESVIQQNLANYEVLKISQRKLLSFLDKEKIASIDDDKRFNEVVALIQTNKQLLKNIAKSRCNLLSDTVDYKMYDIYSSIWHLRNNLWLSKKEKDELYKAVKRLANCTNKDVLMTARQGVRDYFFDLYRFIKRIAGKAEWEELKTIQSLQETIGSQKKMGEELWVIQ